MPHAPRESPTGAPTAERYCGECGQITVGYLTLSSAIPGVAGASHQWICTGEPGEYLRDDKT
jgi:hypothetical protein